MALFPVYTNERSATGVFPADPSFAGGEGGLVVQIAADSDDGYTAVVKAVDASGDCNTALHGLLDEQTTGPGTLIGSYLGASGATAVGPATHLASGKVTVWQASGYFLTDTHAVAASTTVGTALNAVQSGADKGKLTAGSGGATRVTFMGRVSNPADLLASRVSPVAIPADALAQLVLVYQA